MVSGVPDNKYDMTTIGYIEEGSAADGQLQLGDRFLRLKGSC